MRMKEGKEEGGKRGGAMFEPVSQPVVGSISGLPLLSLFLSVAFASFTVPAL